MLDVYVSARGLTIPQHCVCCGGAPQVEYAAAHTRTSGSRVVRTDTRGWAFPYCTRCVGHAHDRFQAKKYLRWGFIAGLVLGLVVAFGTANFAAALATWLLCAVAGAAAATHFRSRAKARCSPDCSTASIAVEYLGWNGTVQGFRFWSHWYAERFALANARVLVNVSPQLRQLLSATPATPPAPTAPSAAAVADRAPSSDQHGALEWIERIESFKGTVARRNALQRALQETPNPEDRLMIMRAASKIEVAAVMAKVDSLATDAAKRRHIQNAIAELAADDVPDEMQTEERRQLEEALAALPT
jgi:hypothetical protein